MPPSQRRERRSGGLGRVAEAAGKQKGILWLKLDDGDEVQLRVIASQFKDAYTHRVPITVEDDKGRSREYMSDVACLDQDDEGIPCPGCKDGIDKRYKFWVPVIVREWEAEDTGKVADTLMVWSQGVTVGKKLDKLNAKRGLELRDVVLEREGSKMNDTRYDLSWTENDKRLLEKVPDLKRYYEPPEYDDFYKSMSERGKDGSDPGQESLNRRGAFARRDQKDADDEKPARRPATQRTSGTTKPAGLAGFGKKGGDKESPPVNTVRRRRRA
jgi:hypothetical protein